MPKPKTVHWHDAASDSPWRTPEEIKDWAVGCYVSLCKTTGEIVYEDRHVIVVAGETDGDGSYGNYTMIPRCLIVKIS